MFSRKKYKPRYVFSFAALLWVSVGALLLLQSLWLYSTYQLAYSQFIVEVNEAFDAACRKEQSYRLPAGALAHTGALTIQRCGTEEIRIIRRCPKPDTVFYDNVSGHSLETVISRAFYELREQVMPLNIHCLADLFGGALHDKGIPMSFVIERFNPATGALLETSAVPDGAEGRVFTHVIITNVSETEGLRANLQFKKRNIFGRMTGALTCSAGLLLVILVCSGMQLWALRHKRYMSVTLPPVAMDTSTDKVFRLGKYYFNVDKSELHGFGEQIHLNRKENGVLNDLCTAPGKVVERSYLLEKHWDSPNGMYSRSLDTYITTLRKYLKHDPSVQIISIKSVGYKLVVNK
jgi:DNA-binding winged helix-turn-helix (wHTH) protein